MANTHPAISQLPSLQEITQWEEPILFDELETPAIPAGLLPGYLGDFAQALALASETPEALSVMVVLGVISACVAKRFVVSPKAGWQEPVNIYTLIVLPPANNKSWVLKHCTQPLIDWELAQAEQFANEIKRQRSERKNQERVIEALRTQMAKEKDSVTQQQLMQDIVEKESQLLEPMALPALFANDATPESLAQHTAEQQGRFAIFSDEGGILETLAGLYSNGSANIDILLKGIDGGDVRVRRKDRSFNLNPFLTLVLTVQPAILQNLSDKRAYLGNGALERFLYVLPKSKLGYRTHDKPPVPQHITLTYAKNIQGLLNCYAAPDKANTFKQPTVLTLSPEAYQDWKQFQATIEVQLRPNGKLAFCQGWGGKIAGFALRLAGLMHIATEAVENTTISEDIMERTLALANVLVEHAIAAYSAMGQDQKIDDAKAIFDWLIAQPKPSFTRTEIRYAMRHKPVGKSDRLLKALALLMERNIINCYRIDTAKPTTIYELHPQLLTQNST
jgi:putative DNA primase/helicase